MSTPSEPAGQVAFITGAAHGQGRATALAMARDGVHVAAPDVAAAVVSLASSKARAITGSEFILDAGLRTR